MLRAIVEEAAALVSLALFLGMIAIWAQVIATPKPAAPAMQVNSASKGDRLQVIVRPDDVYQILLGPLVAS
jgi:hypothetical protein